MSSSEITLDDDLWKDTFDKILEPRGVLRQLNVIKKDVNASYNFNSSIENNSRGNDSSLVPVIVPAPVKPIISIFQTSNVVMKRKRKNKRENKERMKLTVPSISTPVLDRLKKDPFKCAISPIGVRFEYFPNENKFKDLERFEATPIGGVINEVIEYGTEQQNREPSLIEIHKQILSPLVCPIWSRKQNKNGRNVCFDTAENNHLPGVQKNLSMQRHSAETIKAKAVSNAPTESKPARPQSLNLQSGKWRRTLNVWRRTHHIPSTDQSNAGNRKNISGVADETEVVFMGVIPAVGQRKSIFIKNERASVGFDFTLNLSGDEWKSRVLKCCRQRAPKPFAKMYSEDKMQRCRKIGEGAYGEVFLHTVEKSGGRMEDTVLKIIPIEGKTEINGEVQKTFEEIMPEIVISIELCKLQKFRNCKNSTSGYVNLKKVTCIQGLYPKHLVKLWEQYDNDKGSENDHPSVFTEHQLYIVLELSFSGRDLESFQFNNAEQAYYALHQVILTLAVGEEAFEFEHRDLHWGNVLLLNTNEKYLTYKLNDTELSVPTKGVKTSIIDYTLSRMTYNDCCFYNDLSTDEELFTATGDYQFDIYRMMRDVLKNNWETFVPKTNVFWISYIIVKMLDGVFYKNKRSKVHATYLDKLQHLKEIILNFNSATECAQYLYKT